MKNHIQIVVTAAWITSQHSFQVLKMNLFCYCRMINWWAAAVTGLRYFMIWYGIAIAIVILVWNALEMTTKIIVLLSNQFISVFCLRFVFTVWRMITCILCTWKGDDSKRDLHQIKWLQCDLWQHSQNGWLNDGSKTKRLIVESDARKQVISTSNSGPRIINMRPRFSSLAPLGPLCIFPHFCFPWTPASQLNLTSSIVSLNCFRLVGEFCVTHSLRPIMRMRLPPQPKTEKKIKVINKNSWMWCCSHRNIYINSDWIIQSATKIGPIGKVYLHTPHSHT